MQWSQLREEHKKEEMLEALRPGFSTQFARVRHTLEDSRSPYRGFRPMEKEMETNVFWEMIYGLV